MIKCNHCGRDCTEENVKLTMEGGDVLHLCLFCAGIVDEEEVENP